MRSGEVIVATINTNLLFAPNDTVLRSTAQEILSPYRSLLSRGMYKFILTCHTDDTGSVPYTDRLSEARVNAVDAWLSRNIPADVVLVPYALGASEPLYPNDSPVASRRQPAYRDFHSPHRDSGRFCKIRKTQQRFPLIQRSPSAATHFIPSQTLQ